MMKLVFLSSILLSYLSTSLGSVCSGVIPGSNPVLLRWPYITSTTSDSAIISFGTAESILSASVSLHDSQSPFPSLRFNAEEDPLLIEALFMQSLHLFHVQLKGLSADTRYCYSVFANGTEIAGGFSFKTAPNANSTAPVRFIGLGDFGSGTPAQRRVKKAIDSKIDQSDLFLALGDVTYLTGTHFEYQKKDFEVYFDQWSVLPLFLCYGNHDRYALNAKAYLENFIQPYDVSIPIEDRGRYFSFNWGPIHFVSLDTEKALDKDSSDPTSMMYWLERDLAMTDRPWKIALLHKPPYTKGRVVDEKVLEKINPILEKGGVQIAFAGHHHIYERYPSFKNGQTVPISQGGLMYIVSGGGGFPIIGDLIPQPQGGYIYDPNAPTHSEDLLMDADDAPAQPDVYIPEHNYVYVVVDGCDFTLEAIDDEEVVMDKFTISRC